MTHPFRAAVEARDIDAALALLAEDVVFRSPVVFAPYQGREAVAPILRAFSRVAEDFRYVREIGSPGAPDHVLLFQARVGSRELEGSDFLHSRDRRPDRRARRDDPPAQRGARPGGGHEGPARNPGAAAGRRLIP